MADTLTKLGDKAKSYWDQLKSLPPDEGEAQALKYKQANVDTLTAKPVPAPERDTTGTGVGGTAQPYGSKPGEKRLDWAMKPIVAPANTPSYDLGGDVPEDQLAMVHKDEKVLTPEEAEKYRAEHGEGAPADFGGRVIPNPKGLKPILDTDITPRADEPTQDAKMSIDNASLKPPTGDTSNAPLKEAEPTDASTQAKPYSQVIEDKAKEKAAEQVAKPGAQASTSEVPNQIAEQPAEEKAKPTLGQNLAQDWLKKIGASPAPTTTQESTETQIQPRAGLKPIVPQEMGQAKAGGPLGTSQPTSETPREQRDLAGMEHKAKLADYDKQIQAAMNDATPEGREKALLLQQAKENYVKSTPWGSEGNHPGVLGRLGHAAEMVASRAPGLAPIVATLPGSEGYRAAEGRATAAEIPQAEQAVTAREAEENKVEKAGQVPATDAQVKDYQQRIANSGLSSPALATYGKAPTGSTVAELDKRFDEATKLRGMNQKDADTQVAQQSREDAATERKYEHEQTRQDRMAKAYYTYTDKTGTHVTTGDKLDELPEDAQLLPVKDIGSLLGEGRAMNAVQDSLNELHKDLDEHPEVFNNAAARGIVQTTTEQMNRVAATMLIAGTGGAIPLPSGMGDMINTALQNSALDDKTAKAVKDYIADYKAAKDKAMTIQMMMQNGKMGRGGQQAFESIVNQLPGGSTPDNATALRQMSALQRTSSTLANKYPEEYGDYKKTKPYEAKNAPAPTGATGEVVVDGKIVGHVITGADGKQKYQALQQ